MPNPTAAPLPRECPFCHGLAEGSKDEDWAACLKEECPGYNGGGWDAWNRRAPSPSREGWLPDAEAVKEVAAEIRETVLEGLADVSCGGLSVVKSCPGLDALEAMALSALEPSTGKAGWMPISEAAHSWMPLLGIDMLRHTEDDPHFFVMHRRPGRWVSGDRTVFPTHFQPVTPPGAETPKEVGRG